MKPIILFIFGLTLGFITAAALFLLASQKYTSSIKSVESGQFINARHAMQEAQTLWPLYRLDTKFQSDLLQLQNKKNQGDKNIISIFLKNDAQQSDVESFINQLEVMDGVTQVEWNTLSDPHSYVANLSHLPESVDDVRDYVNVIMDNGKNIEQITEFASFQDSVYKISTQN